MPTITVTDGVGLKVDLNIGGDSDAAHFGLQALRAKTAELFDQLNKPLDQVTLKSCDLGPSFTSPKIPLGTGLELQAGGNTTAGLGVFRSEDKTLFAPDHLSPEINIGSTDCWVAFEWETALNIALQAASPSGFGLCGEKAQQIKAASYTLLHADGAPFPTLKQGLEQALANFHVARDAASIRALHAPGIATWDAAGDFELGVSYSLPLSVNCLSLATLKLPLDQAVKIAPEAVVSVKGTCKISGEFEGRCYRLDGTRLQLGLYKKKETDLTATFCAAAGVEAEAGSTDLLGALFSILPGANLNATDLSDEDRKTMSEALKSALSQGMTVALNEACTASLANEAAVLYEIDLSADTAATDSAINQALAGNWSALAMLGSARELRNLTVETHERQAKTTLNLLGLYDRASIDDFARSCTVLHNLADGTITVTDKVTAQRIAAAGTPFLAQDDRLRQVVDEAFITTATYAAALSGHAASASLRARQSYSLYKARASTSDVRKNLLVGRALGQLSDGDIAAAVGAGSFRYFKVGATVDFPPSIALALFFTDVAQRTPRSAVEMRKLGRQTLAALLDRTQPADDARWRVLNDDAAWAEMDQQHFPANSPASYSDWFDITVWADAISGVGAPLAAALLAAAQASGDPSSDPGFMQKRDDLAKALNTLGRRSHAAFERGWPAAVMFALSGRQASANFHAAWNGATHFESQPVAALESQPRALGSAGD